MRLRWKSSCSPSSLAAALLSAPAPALLPPGTALLGGAGFCASSLRSLQVLPNGHILFGNTHAGPNQPQLIEVTRDKKVVWEFADHANFKTINQIQSLDVKGDATKGDDVRHAA